MEMIERSIAGIIPAVVAAIAVTKIVFPTLGEEKGKRFIPLVALGFALALTWLVVGGDVKEIALDAFIVTLSSMGLWSGGKAVAGK